MKTNYLKTVLFYAFLFILIGSGLNSCIEDDAPIPNVVISDLRVDLRAQQTSIKNQEGRGSCIVFAATAALEANYKRFGYGDLDLSEEFLNYMGKNIWLHQNWDEIYNAGPDAIENQGAAFSGGGGAYYIEAMIKNGMRIPTEAIMPYVPFESIYETNPNYIGWPIPAGTKQKDMNSFNLDTVNLKRSILHADKFYRAAAGKYYPWTTEKAKDTDLIESILREKQEVVWDFAGKVKVNNNIWQPAGPGESGQNLAHSMLIVGFDKTDADPSKHYFMVKNSWGNNIHSTHMGDPDHLTYISYEMVRQLGTEMAYIIAPATPGPWEDLKKLGRYTLSYASLPTTLDFYHIPGYFKPDFLGGVTDRRIGSFYNLGIPYRVNGSFEGNKITFYINDENQDCRWDQLNGTKYTMYYDEESDIMAGYFEEIGNVYGVYARKKGLFPSDIITPTPYGPNSFEYSDWQLHFREFNGKLKLLAYNQNEDYIPGLLAVGSQIYAVEAHKVGSDYSHMTLSIRNSAGILLKTLDIRHIPFRGTMAGYSMETTPYPAVLVRQPSVN